MGTIKELLKRVRLESLKFQSNFVEVEISFNNNEKDAAWELYVEMITRVVTQNLKLTDGDEKSALESVYSLFPITREILKRRGRDCTQFAKIAVAVLNQIVRPFTAKWHKKSLKGAFQDSKECQAFRDDLRKLQKKLCKYTHLLAVVADVEDLTYINAEFNEK